jgi:hypothetical protein
MRRTLLFEKNGDLVGGWQILNHDDLFIIDLTEVCNLVDGATIEVYLTTASDQIGNQARATDRLDSLLCWLRLLLAVDERHIGNVDLQEIVLSSTTAQLGHGLNKGHALDVAYRAP